MARHDVPESSRDALRRAFRLLFRSECNISDAILQILEAPGETPPEVLHLVAFMREIDEGSRGRSQNP
jgi:acyl-[acyl carrier protein]--UDP-N-acetylglucosamine O-acyltransferase